MDLEAAITNLLSRVEALEQAAREAAPPAKAKASKATLPEMVAYCQERGLTAEDGEWFGDKMEASGWRNNGKPVVCWKATIRTWQRIAIFPSQKAPGTAGQGQPSEVSVYVLQRQLERMEADAATHRNQYRNHDTHEWDSMEDRRKYRAMWDQIQVVKDQINKRLNLK